MGGGRRVAPPGLQESGVRRFQGLRSLRSLQPWLPSDAAPRLHPRLQPPEGATEGSQWLRSLHPWLPSDAAPRLHPRLQPPEGATEGSQGWSERSERNPWNWNASAPNGL